MTRFFLAAQTDKALLFLRLAFGLMMMVHGWAKLAGFAELSENFADPFGVGPGISVSLSIFAEFACSILLILGALTRLALIPLIINMLVVVIFVFGTAPWKSKELGAIYLVAYLTLMISGPGRLSLDHIFFGKKEAV